MKQQTARWRCSESLLLDWLVQTVQLPVHCSPHKNQPETEHQFYFFHLYGLKLLQFRLHVWNKPVVSVWPAWSWGSDWLHTDPPEPQQKPSENQEHRKSGRPHLLSLTGQLSITQVTYPAQVRFSQQSPEGGVVLCVTSQVSTHMIQLLPPETWKQK